MNSGAGFARLAALLCAVLILSACSPDVEWPGYGGDGENHWSPLDEVNTGNVGKLGLAWHYDIEAPGSTFTAPVEANGVVYFASGLSIVHALNAETGKLLWQYDPRVVDHAGDELRAVWGIRGMAYAGGRVFVGTADGRLVALDAGSGKPEWAAKTTQKGDGRYISAAPWVYKNTVIIGHGGGDFVAARGYVTAYDQTTGKQLWRFYTVPGDPAKGFENKAMEMAAKTWKGERWKQGGGGTAWNAMAYDPKYNRIYIGTGNGGPWNQKIRSPGGGDNLFVCSILALDADTGEYAWHYQVNPGESWDYNAAMDMTLTTVTIGGKQRDVLITAPKNGFLYVLDRETGKFISAGQIAYQNWNLGFDANGRPIENPAARYPDGKPFLLYPSIYGAHGPEAMSYSPVTGLVYIPTSHSGTVFIDPPGKLEDWQPTPRQGVNGGIGAPPAGITQPDPTSALLAWDPVRQKEAWRIPFKGEATGGGTMATAGGLVFQGRITGEFAALDAGSGKQLWSFRAPAPIRAQPISYRVNGRQYVTVITGGRQIPARTLARVPDYRTDRRQVLTFALGGKDTLPATTTGPMPYQDDPAFRVDPGLARAGAITFATRCTVCHGYDAMSGGNGPHLLRSPVPLDRAAFVSVVRDGALLANGMPKFDELNDAEIDGLLHYIRQRAREEIAAGGAQPRPR